MISDPFANRYSDTKNEGSVDLTVNGLHCTFNMPKAVERRRDAQGNEIVAGLPPGAPRIGYPVDKFPAAPESWMHGSGVASSYFVPILPEHGMWLDFNRNSSHSHHVAAVVSVQGVNPLTGMKTDPIRLEQYRNQCPKHSVEFQQNRYCPSCKFEWHPQNYLSSNNGSPFWIDGFRTEDGVIRQWYFTEEECKGVAAQLIGKERVFAIGIAFYLSKQPKPAPVYRGRSYGYGGGFALCAAGGSNFLSATPMNYSYADESDSDDYALESCVVAASASLCSDAPTTRSINNAETARSIEKAAKKLEIGAGAKIHQKINADPENLDFWQDKPAGMLYITYCDVATAERVLAAGKRQDQPDGFLGGLAIKD